MFKEEDQKGEAFLYILGLHTIGVGKPFIGKGGHCTYFIDGGTIWVGTPHNIERTYMYHLIWLECARFSAYLKIHDGPQCGGGTAHILCRWGKQFGWGHCTTLKEHMHLLI